MSSEEEKNYDLENKDNNSNENEENLNRENKDQDINERNKIIL